MSTLADRIKIARMTSSSEDEGPDISFSIQFILNCGGEIAGSCHGGENLSTFYEFSAVINLQSTAIATHSIRTVTASLRQDRRQVHLNSLKMLDMYLMKHVCRI